MCYRLTIATVVTALFAVGAVWAQGSPVTPPDLCPNPNGDPFADPVPCYKKYVPVALGGVLPFLQNGDFEQGNVAWTEAAGNNTPIIVSEQVNGIDVPVAPHSGQWLAWLGGENSRTTTIVQTVVVPADKPVLSYWFYVRSFQLDCNAEFFYLIINNEIRGTLPLCFSSSFNFRWVKASIDLSVYRNQVIPISFHVVGDSSHFVDDVAFEPLSSFPTPAPTAIPTTNPIPTQPTQPDFDNNGDGRVTCADFRTRSEARAALRAGYTNLDNDNDGIPCESLPP
jgi:hypothetical protein